MNRDEELALTERLRARIGEPPRTSEDARVERSAYVSTARFDGECAMFRRVPLAIAHASELKSPGDFVTREVAGVPLLLVRGEDGIRTFVNVCRHRGTRLVATPSGHAKAFPCRYHAWTYDCSGALTHVPHRATFPTLDVASRGLVALPCEVRHGIVWAVLDPGPISAGAEDANARIDVKSHLGAVDDDLTAFGFDDHVQLESVSQRRACNWKLVIEAFLEGYHAKFLHAKTIARFFLDGVVVIDRFAKHVRSAGGRRELARWDELPEEARTIRTAATLFYFVFPNTILVLHPDWISHITMVPETVGTSTYTHAMLVPRARAMDSEVAHWRETWELIEANVFQKEDLAVAESIQSGLAAGFEHEFVLGGLELPIRYFHDALETELRASHGG